jgi:hypothetical protein
VLRAQHSLFLVALSVLLAGCGIARQRELQAQREALQAQSKAAVEQCNQTYPTGDPKTAVARAKCENEAVGIQRPLMPYPDLMDLFFASRIAIAEQFQNGKITLAQANETLAIKRSEIIAEEQRRVNSNRAVAAQQQAASAAMIGALSAGAPRTCTTFGNTTNCY